MKGDEILAVIVLALVLLSIPLVIWARIAAPCEWIDWLPIADAPVRCLK